MALSLNSDKLREFLSSLLLLIFILLIGFGVTNVFGNSQAAFQSQDIFNVTTYYSWFGIFAFILFSIIMYTLFSNYKDSEYGNSIFFANLGDWPSFKVFKRFTKIQFSWLFLIFLIAFSIFIISTKPQTTFTGVLAQQFTQAGKTLYDTFLIPAAENIGIAMWFAIISLSLGLVARKTNMNKNTLRVLLFVALVISGAVIGFLNHQLNPIYSSSEVNSETATAFWGIGGAVTYVTGFFIPFYEMHLVNNIVYDLQGLMSVDVLRQWLIGIDVLLFFGYIFVYNKRWFGVSNGKAVKPDKAFY